MQSVLGTIIQSLLLSHIFKYKLYFHPSDFSGVMLCTPAGGLVLFFALFNFCFILFFFRFFCFVLGCLERELSVWYKTSMVLNWGNHSWKFSLHWISTQSVHCVQTEGVLSVHDSLITPLQMCCLLFGFRKCLFFSINKFEHKRKSLVIKLGETAKVINN